MKISREDVLRVAELAKLDLTEDEITTYGGQLESILSYCEKLNELDTTGVEPMAQVLTTGARGPEQGSTEDDEQHLREDVVVRSDVVGDVLGGAPDPNPPYFRVPRVIDR
jgi:aspartyl-tRNA(Asn)/glutamyl-tRNA(Gln) amidotransferase subunit C